MYEVNRNLVQQAFRIGNEQTPVFIVDDFLVDLSATRQEAIALAYTDDNTNFAGEYWSQDTGRR